MGNAGEQGALAQVSTPVPPAGTERKEKEPMMAEETPRSQVIREAVGSFADKAHFVFGAVPGDGVHVWWQMVLGPTRGRYFLLTGEEIGVEEAKRLGIVNEILSPDQLMTRAWALARELAKQPRVVRRYSRVVLNQHIKRRLLDDLGYGLALEAVGMMGR